jgi:photosystem II stability/assembly factor-like uncharacterized protein
MGDVKIILRRIPALLLLSAFSWLGDPQAVAAPSAVWTTNGPEGATVSALALDPQSPDTLYAGTVDNGVFKSTDAGGRWSAINAGLGDLRITELAIDPQSVSTLYAGTSSGGVFKSIDAGGSWSAINAGLNYVTASIGALAIDPQVPATLYAGTSSGGVFKSTDGGSIWVAASAGLPGLGITTLAIDPKHGWRGQLEQQLHRAKRSRCRRHGH